MKAPLIAVLSVGVAAAVPAVAISASAPNDVKAIETTVSTTKTTTTHDAGQDRRAASAQVGEALPEAPEAAQPPGCGARRPEGAQGTRTRSRLRWSDRALVRANRKLGKRIRGVREDLRDKRAGLTPGVRATLQRIATCESHGNPRAIGGGGPYRGKYRLRSGPGPRLAVRATPPCLRARAGPPCREAADTQWTRALARLRLVAPPNNVVSSGPPWRLRVSTHTAPRRTPDEASP